MVLYMIYIILPYRYITVTVAQRHHYTYYNLNKMMKVRTYFNMII